MHSAILISATVLALAITTVYYPLPNTAPVGISEHETVTREDAPVRPRQVGLMNPSVADAHTAFRPVFEEYKAFHDAMVASDKPLFDKRFLVCIPENGIGNKLNTIMSCFALALATRRALLLRFDDFYQLPLSDWLRSSLQWDAATVLPSSIPRHGVQTIKEDDLGEPYLGNAVACRDFNTTFSAPVLEYQGWSANLLALTNPSIYRVLAPLLPLDAVGSLAVFQSSVHHLISLPPATRTLVDAVHSFAVPSSYHVAMYLRMGIDDFDEFVERPGRNEKTVLPLVSAAMMCAYAYTPLTSRSEPMTFSMVTDKRSVRPAIVKSFISNEGPIVAVLGDTVYAQSSSGVTLAEHKVETDVPDSVLTQLSRHALVVLEFASGSRLIFFDSNPSKHTLHTRDSAILSVMEAWMSEHADTIIVSENSSYGQIAYSLHGAVPIMLTRGARCYPIPSREPIAGAEWRDQAKCYTDKKRSTFNFIWAKEVARHIYHLAEKKG